MEIYEYTPELMTEKDFFNQDGTPKNNTFVFGSNLLGIHAGGAAYFANNSLGAEIGIGEGFADINLLTYAFPTLKTPGGAFGETEENKLSLDDIERSMAKLMGIVNDHPDRIFYLTKIGCGIAGFTIEEVGNIFGLTYGHQPNLIYPEEFTEYIKNWFI